MHSSSPQFYLCNAHFYLINPFFLTIFLLTPLTLCIFFLLALSSPMASNGQASQAAPNGAKLPVDVERHVGKQAEEEELNYSQRAQWLRAAVLGANDGLVSTASLMMGVGAVKTDTKAMIVSGFAGLVAGACSMAIGEFVSVYSQLDIEVAQMKRMKEEELDEAGGEKVALPSPVQAAVASALAFSVGAAVPLLTAAFISNHQVRLGVVASAVTLALLVFGGVGAKLGKAPMARSCARVMFGGWLAMLVTFGIMKLFGSAVLKTN